MPNSAIAEVNTAGKKPSWRSLFHFAGPSACVLLVFAILCALLASVIIPAQAYLFGDLTQELSMLATGSVTKAAFAAAMNSKLLKLAYLSVYALFMHACFFAVWVAFGIRLATRGQQILHRTMIRYSAEWFDKRKDGVGALVTRINAYLDELHRAMSQPLGQLIQSIFTALASYGVSLYMSWKLTLAMTAVMPVSIFVVWTISIRAKPAIISQQEQMSTAAKGLHTALSSIETVKCLNGQDFECERYLLSLHKASGYYNRQSLWFAIQYAMTRLVTMLLFVLAFWFGAFLLDDDEITQQAIMITFIATFMTFSSVMQIFPQLTVLSKGQIAATGLQLLQTALTSSNTSEDKRLYKPEGRRFMGIIYFSSVSFAYPSRPNQLVLQDVTMDLDQEWLFIVGKSGSGKSTLGQLLIRAYEPTGGYIRFDLPELHTLHPEWVRTQVLLVEQHSVLFSGTIFNNIASGLLEGEATLEDVKDAAKFANVHRDITRLPEGYNTQVGSNGVSLSGGQRQRIALARAYLRNPNVLILDECTSALDLPNRTAVMNRIRQWRRNELVDGLNTHKRTYIITHDVSQIQSHDFVFVMKDGKVAEGDTRHRLENNQMSEFNQLVGSAEAVPGLSMAPMDLDKSLPPTPHIHNGDELGADNSSLLNADDAAVDPLDQYLRRFDEEDARNAQFMPSLIPDATSIAPFRYSVFLGPSTSPPTLATPTTNRNGALFSFPQRIRRRESAQPVDLKWFRPQNSAHDVQSSAVQSSSAILQRNCPDKAVMQLQALGRYVFSPRNSMTEDIIRRAKREPGVEAIPLQNLETTKPEKRARENIESPKPTKTTSKEMVKPEEEKTLSLWQILKTVWPCFDWNLRLRLLVAILAATLYATATPMFSFVFGKLLTSLFNPVDRLHNTMINSLYMVLIIIVDSGASFAQQRNFEHCAQAWVNVQRVTGYGKVLFQPRKFFDQDENGVSQLMEHFDADAERMQGILARYVGYLYITIVMLTIALIWSMISCWKLTLVLIGLVVCLFIASWLYTLVSNGCDHKIANYAERAMAIFMESFTHISTVRALSLEQRRDEAHEKACKAVFRAGLWKILVCTPFHGSIPSALIGLTALAFHTAAVLLASGEYSLEQIFRVLTLLLWTVANASSIFAFLPQGSAAQVAATRVLRLVQLRLSSFETNGTCWIGDVGTIEFHSVNFSYPTRPQHLVLHNLSLTIAPGSCVAIVGGSGSGKSTLSALLLKLQSTGDADRPAITLGGRDIREIYTTILRILITIVPQTPVLFPLTVAENITYGLPRSSPLAHQDNVHRAAVAAGIADFILSLPDGYNTAIGEGGLGVSGGQAQRIAIARALVREPNVLILDEATSALDPESAQAIRTTVINLLQENRQGQPSQPPLTVIVITHDRKMMDFSDEVVMLHEGQVVDQGPYDELLSKRNRRGPFARLMRGEKFARDTEAVKRRSLIAMNNSPGIIRSVWVMGTRSDGT